MRARDIVIDIVCQVNQRIFILFLMKAVDSLVFNIELLKFHFLVGYEATGNRTCSLDLFACVDVRNLVLSW